MAEGAPVPLLQVDGLTKKFGGVVALDSLSLSVESGEVVGLIGPNGSGKTTFFNVTTGIYRPDAGRIAFQGRNLAGASPQTIHRAGISRTFQRSRLALPLSIFDNIMIGAHTHRSNGLWFNLVRRGALKREYEEKLEAARALLKVFEPELADRMFEPVMGLPMIDRRRIEICRALISEPMLLFLDEPSAGMTHEETRALMDNILQVRAMRTSLAIVIVEHQMGVIERITGRCAVLNFGSKIAEGTYREVASDPEVQEAYLGAAS
jgi:branched-chain amino acid transport system ATP-binding protein/sulfate-transporting ATPase